MSTPLDCYFGFVYDPVDNDPNEVQQLVQVKAVSFNDAKQRVLKSVEDSGYSCPIVTVQRHKPGAMVASPADIERAKHKAKPKKRAPQYGGR